MLADLILLEKYSDLNELKEKAERLGNNALILAKTFSKEELKKLNEKIKQEKFAFFTCHVLDKTDARELNDFKNSADFIAVKGSSIELNKFAASQKKVDFLLHPFSKEKLTFDTGTAQLAKNNEIKIAFLFNEFNSVQGFQRSQMLKNAFFTVKLLKKYELNALFFSGARSLNEFRAVKDFISLSELLGFSLSQSKRFIDVLPEKLLEELK